SFFLWTSTYIPPTRSPEAVSYRQAANPLSRSRPSPSPMAGELLDDRVIVHDPAEGSGVYNRGFFGTPRSGGGLELNLLEAVYLVEGGRLEVRRRGRAVSARALFRAASASVSAFEIRSILLRDRRDRAVVIDEAQAKALHDAGFFGKIVGRRLQLSLLETAYLLKAGLVEVRNAETDRPIRLPRLVKEAKTIQPDFELRLQAYE